MAPAFNSIPAVDIRDLAYRATFVKVAGSKAVCCDGQAVNGLIVVREVVVYRNRKALEYFSLNSRLQKIH
ncbi:hypothetical protein C6341_g27757 [Phytophthora cactorum]|nr:hypothetical protein C6341_g27757 [Phytophthora cactorum]